MILKAVVAVLLVVQIVGVELANEERKYQEDETHVTFTDGTGRQVKLNKDEFQTISQQYHKDHKKPKKDYFEKKYRDYKDKTDKDKQYHKKENKDKYKDKIEDSYLRKTHKDTNDKRINDKQKKYYDKFNERNDKREDRNELDEEVSEKKWDYHEKHDIQRDHREKQERREGKKKYHKDKQDDNDDNDDNNDSRTNDIDDDDDDDDNGRDDKRHHDKHGHGDRKNKHERRNKEEWDDERQDKKRHHESGKHQKHHHDDNDDEDDDNDDDDDGDDSGELLHDTDVNYVRSRPINKDSEPVPNIKENYISNFQNTGDVVKRVKKDFYEDLKVIDLSRPPSHNDTVLMARYIIHKADWASVATISTQIGVKNFPFVNVFSMSDGPVNKGIGVPFFYLTPLDISSQDLSKDNHCSITATLAQTEYCKKQVLDPEDPRCARVILSGKLKKVKANTTEEDFAEEAIFSRHPQMKSWPSDHDWYFAKLKIAQILVLDYFGGAKNIDVQEYLNAEPKK